MVPLMCLPLLLVHFGVGCLVGTARFEARVIDVLEPGSTRLLVLAVVCWPLALVGRLIVRVERGAS